MHSEKTPQRTSMSFSWLAKMAWRDSRRNRSRLLLFISSIILGIAVLVAIYSFRDNLQRDIDEQAKALTGADLIIESRKPVSVAMSEMLDTLGNERSTERSFASMLYFVKSQGNRLVQIRALQGDYPYYGTIETTPVSAGSDFKNGRNALVDQALMLQYHAAVGDSIKVGALAFKIEGVLDKAPGQTGISSSVAPIVYIPLQYLEETGLNKIGSRISYKYYFKYNQPAVVAKVLKKIQPKLDKEGMDAKTVESSKEDTGRSFRDVNRFLALSGFIALLLGCIGVGSAIHVYIGEKLGSIATLRCLGVKAREAFLIYLIQIACIGLIGALAGAVLGTLIQFALPAVLKDFIPVEMTMHISWIAISQGMVLGLLISVLFALPSLLSVRKISPLNALRASFEKASVATDPYKWLVYALILIFIYVFTFLQMSSWLQALMFTGSVMIAFALLYALSKLLMWLVRHLIPGSMNYLWRQGFANLYRPNNQTLMLTVSIGLATAFIATLFFVQGILINRVTLSSGAHQPNMILFDIQSSQKESVAQITRVYHLPVLSQVPVVTVRIQEINGKTAADITKSKKHAEVNDDSISEKNDVSGSAFRNELRVTFQDSLTDAEKVVKGKWTGQVKQPDGKVFISLDENYAKHIHVDIGDEILFNVQGVTVPTVVGSLRSINWSRMQTNFRVVFPTGVLEDAPQFHVLMTKVPSSKVSARYQTAIVQHFPNVSVIDLQLILKVLEDLLSKIGFVIRFMAAFSMATGWIVLIAAVLISKNQRLKESVLLRTLGASRKQILTITALEYLFLGLLASGAGIILALVGSWALAVFSFDATFSPAIIPVLILLGSISLIVVLTGVLSSRNILQHPPLEVLRR